MIIALYFIQYFNQNPYTQVGVHFYKKMQKVGFRARGEKNSQETESLMGIYSHGHTLGSVMDPFEKIDSKPQKTTTKNKL